MKLTTGVDRCKQILKRRAGARTQGFTLAFRPERARHGGMLDADRFKRLFGSYRMPRCRVGRWLTCAVRGKVQVAVISDAPISWPQCNAGKHLVPIACASLIRAVRRESVIAVAHHWGMSPQTVRLWRKALGVSGQTVGTRKLRQRWAPEVLAAETRELARQASTSADHRE